MLGAVNRSGCGRGITLIEVLIVVAIIGLLLAMLGFAISGYVMEHYYTVECANNLHHIFGAIHIGEGGHLPAPYVWVARARDAGGVSLLTCPKADSLGGGKAGPVGITGGIRQIDPPPDARFNSLESNNDIYCFLEQEGYTLPTDVPVDISRPGYYDRDYGSTAKTIPAGTDVDCYFLHYDPIGSQNATTQGEVRTGGEIIGIIVQSRTLDATDPMLGRPGTDYSTGQGSRGYEGGAERVELKEDMRTFVIHHYQSTFPGEEVRILTQPSGGGMAAYGMNMMVPTTGAPPGLILIMDYSRSVMDYDKNYEDDVWDEEIRPRHDGKMNVMFVDGHIDLLPPEEVNPKDHPELWYPYYYDRTH